MLRGYFIIRYKATVRRTEREMKYASDVNGSTNNCFGSAKALTGYN
jgi:hypothetical protein